VTLLFQRWLLRGVRRSCQRNERKHQQDGPHLGLQKVMRSPESAAVGVYASASAPRM
jgi:hypothetical protein